MEKEIKLETGEIIKLPNGIVCELNTEWLGCNIYFKNLKTYIPQNASVLLAIEKIKDLLLAYFKNVRKVEKYLLTPSLTRSNKEK